MPLPILQAPWEDESMDFVYGLLHIKEVIISALTVGHFSSIDHFVPGRRPDASNVARLYLCKVVKLDGIPKSIT